MLVTMSGKELCRLPVIQAVVEKRLRRRDAASQLQLTERQVQRLMNRFRVSGADGLTHARRGKSGANRLDDSLRLRIMALLREKYSDFGPTLAAEKLSERHNIRVSVETLRKWMTADGLWVPHSRRKPWVYHHVIGVIALVSLFRLMALTTTGLKAVHQNAAFWFTWMMLLAG